MGNNIAQVSLIAGNTVTLINIKQKFIDREVENIKSPPF